jgi:hypothetical protein
MDFDGIETHPTLGYSSVHYFILWQQKIQLKSISLKACIHNQSFHQKLRESFLTKNLLKENF